MDTTALKNFATWARRELTREVDARLTSALAPGSTDRIERASAVAALEADIADSGDRDSILDKVSYTWFNRIIALRFMDANNYTGVGVVSSAYGQPLGQPEVLTEAKRGSVDPDVVHPQTRTKILELLDGTRRSNDPQGEAYRTLLAAYCGHWSKFMPFMFEREDAYTNLLMPGNLLADESVLNRTVEVLTPEVCEDVEVIGWLYQFYISERKQEVFAGFRAKGKARKLAGPDEIPAATQLFTPEWIVRYLVENSLGRLWMLNRPDSSLIDQMDYYIAPVDEEPDFLRIDSPEELTILDPACGSGHMLTYAFDLLYAIYEEEGYAPSEIPSLILTHNIYGTEIDERAGALAAFALTMKARAKQRRFFNKQVQPNICVIESISLSDAELSSLFTRESDYEEEEIFWNQFQNAGTFGSLIRPKFDMTIRLNEKIIDLANRDPLLDRETLYKAERVIKQAKYLTTFYAAIVANPPYMGRGKMGELLVKFIDNNYPHSSWGLDASFIDRVGSMVKTGGLSALITMQSWMYLSSYEQFRRNLLNRRSIATLCHLGTGVFDSFGGEVVSVVATVFRHTTSPAKGTYLRLVKREDHREAFHEAVANPRHTHRYERSSAEFLKIRGIIIAYFADKSISDFLAGNPLRKFVKSGVGSQTGANDRFIRYWFEISHSNINLAGRKGVDKKKWTPSTKGGEFRRWYNPTVHVMDWREEGELIKRESPGAVIRNENLYFKENLSWSKVGTRTPSFRYSDERVVHNDASCFIVTQDVPLDSVSGYLNSRTVTSLVKDLNPTLNLLPATLLDFPFVEVNPLNGKICRTLSKKDWDREELSLDFSEPIICEEVQNSRLIDIINSVLKYNDAVTRELSRAENEIEREVSAAIGLGTPEIIPDHEHSLLANSKYRYGPGHLEEEYTKFATRDLIRDLVSYAVGCMFGRYSLDEPGLILADQGSTLEDYLAKVPEPTFTPDTDNVIPIVDGDWFEDDIVSRFREFLRVAFGEQHFEENLRFVEESLGGKDLRSYFITGRGKSQFYEDHVRRYRKRPIYWLFSSPKGSFNALIYLHRYNPSTASTVLNEYLREYIGKLEASLQNHERNGETKEADHIRKILVELRDYEHDVLYPLASQQIALDLDDGVKMNYPKIGTALKKIPGLGGGK